MTMPTHDARRRAFGDFLRSRRERLTPASVGLPEGQRRRTPGLRREEVAQLSGLGTTWYTWLEQGRDVRPSAEVIVALSRALKLDDVERDHLAKLADRPRVSRHAADPEAVPEPLQRMLDSLDGQPAYVTGRRWDVLAWNSAAAAVFGDYGRLSGDARNIMHMIFTNPDHRRLLTDWDQVASSALAMFRADCAHHAGDPEFERLVALLMKESAVFKALWQRNDVVRPFAGHKRIDHPKAGPMTFEHTSFTVQKGADMRLVVFTPLPENDTSAKLARLVAA